jgi:hypothetical protein
MAATGKFSPALRSKASLILRHRLRFSPRSEQNFLGFAHSYPSRISLKAKLREAGAPVGISTD